MSARCWYTDFERIVARTAATRMLGANFGELLLAYARRSNRPSYLFPTYLKNQGNVIQFKSVSIFAVPVPRYDECLQRGRNDQVF